MDKIVEPEVIHCSMISVLVEQVVHLQTVAGSAATEAPERSAC